MLVNFFQTNMLTISNDEKNHASHHWFQEIQIVSGETWYLQWKSACTWINKTRSQIDVEEATEEEEEVEEK